MRIVAIGLLLGALLGVAAEKKPVVAQASNDKLAITATLIQDADAIRQELGEALPAGFIVVRVELTPKSGKPLVVNRDDFILHNFNDGEKCRPFAPTQIAGRGGIDLRSEGGNARVKTGSSGPMISGIPGIGGGSKRMPGSGGKTGSTPAASATAQPTPTPTGKEQDKDSPLLAALKQRVLPEKETSDPLAGLLYFAIEGKHKIKDLGLQYIGPAGRLVLEFR
ncbi:MAG: hypothetical protein ABSG25_13315 [Bryobacteraceae bacterium]